MIFRPAHAAAAGLAAVLAAGVLGSQAVAHHAFQAEYDCVPVTVTGQVTRVEWVNPHAFVHIHSNQKARPDWKFEGGTPATLDRLGLNRESLKAGDTVTVRGYLAKDRRCPDDPQSHVATCHGAGGAIVLANGTISNLVEGSRILNHSSFDRYGASPEQMLSQLTDFCSPPETRGK